MRLYKIVIPIIFITISCNLFEDEISFTSKEESYSTRYEILMPDSINVTEYSIFRDDAMYEKYKFVYDSLRTEKWKYDKNSKIESKRIYYFSVDNYNIVIDTVRIDDEISFDTLYINLNNFAKRRNAIFTIDTLFFSDSILIVESEYSYNDSMVTEIRTEEYSLNGGYRKSGYLRNFYNKEDNKIKINYEKGDGLCVNEMTYSDFDNFVNIQTFENELLGKINSNLILQVFWEKGCNEEKYQVKPSSLYSYEFNSKGYVSRQREEYTPEYMEFVGTKVERKIRTTNYVYFFE